MKISLLDLKRQYVQIESEFKKKIDNIFANSSFIMGEEVKSFEKNIAEYLNVKHAISVGNGTDALVIALKSLGIKEGDEVVTTAYTFFATAESIRAAGATPVFVDVRKDTFNIDETLVEESITPKTKAILFVDLFGEPANIPALREIATKHNLYLVEDSCQAIGSEYLGKKIGSLADITAFSFFPTKNLGCAGDGGLIVTNDDKIDVICKALRVHGSGENGKLAFEYLNNCTIEEKQDTSSSNKDFDARKYYNYLIGYNTRLDEIQAALLNLKLPLLDKWTEERRNIAKYYNEQLKDTSFITPYEDPNTKHVYHLYILQSEKREEVVSFLKEKGIATGVYYKVPMHLQYAFKDLNYKEGDLKASEYLSKRTFAIPLYVGMTKEEQDYVINALKEFDKNEK